MVVAGRVARRDPELIGRAVLKGLLDRVTAQAVNLVNAHLVARERGLQVVVETDEDAASGYTNLVTVTTHAGGGRKVIAGTVFDGVPRIVRLKDLHVEFIPEGHILVLSYEDRPGMVGTIGSILGRNNVNIASMHVGRRTKRGRAIVVLLLDEEVPPEVMEEVGEGGRGRLRAPRSTSRHEDTRHDPAPRHRRSRTLSCCDRGAVSRRIEEGRGYKVKRLVVEPGSRLSLQRHRYRAEHWVWWPALRASSSAGARGGFGSGGRSTCREAHGTGSRIRAGSTRGDHRGSARPVPGRGRHHPARGRLRTGRSRRVAGDSSRPGADGREEAGPARAGWVREFPPDVPVAQVGR